MLSSHRLRAMLADVERHIPDHPRARARGVLLAADGTHLHAVACDHQTLAVSRTRLGGPPWTAVVDQPHLSLVRSLLAGRRAEQVRLRRDGDGLVVAVPGASVTLPGSPGQADAWPDWRGRLLLALAGGPVPGPVRTRADLLDRWGPPPGEPAEPMAIWTTVGGIVVVARGRHFLGLQWPVPADGPACTPDTVHAAWVPVPV